VNDWRGAPIRFLAGIRGSFHAFLATALALAMLARYYQDQAESADRELSELRSTIVTLTAGQQPDNPETPPIVHPKHPPRLGGEYYRGNDERSEKLYNGGFYRTATMRIALCDENRRPLSWGDRLSTDGMFVRIEIERSPFTAEILFAETVWNDTFVSELTSGSAVTDYSRQVRRFERTRDGLWVCFYPISRQSATLEQPATGALYIYRGEASESAVSADPHYGIEYSIVIRDGIIGESSELWMGFVLRTANVFVVPDGKIASDEWFSFRPIPEIPHDQSRLDEDLLGITGHAAELQGGPNADNPPDGDGPHREPNSRGASE
jgi:hypothetical protein